MTQVAHEEKQYVTSFEADQLEQSGITFQQHTAAVLIPSGYLVLSHQGFSPLSRHEALDAC